MPLLVLPLGLGGGGGSAGTPVNFSLALSDLYAPLNATGPPDLVFWSSDELIKWFDEAVQRLARTAGVFVVRDTSLSSAEAQGDYTLPAAHLSTIQADLEGKVLRPRTVQEIEALDSDWPRTGGAPEAFLQDTQGVRRFTVYPAPDADHDAQAIGLVMRAAPDPVTSSDALLAAPLCAIEYFHFFALGEARAKETRGAMPEVAEWYRQLAGMYEQVFTSYWGSAL